MSTTFIPDIPAPSAEVPSWARRMLEPTRETLQIREGRRGPSIDQNVTFRDLIELDLLQLPDGSSVAPRVRPDVSTSPGLYAHGTHSAGGAIPNPSLAQVVNATTTPVVITSPYRSTLFVQATLGLHLSALNTAIVGAIVSIHLQRNGVTIKTASPHVAVPNFGGNMAIQIVVPFVYADVTDVGAHAYRFAYSYEFRNASNATVAPTGGSYAHEAYILVRT